jgi:hypothetical protein
MTNPVHSTGTLKPPGSTGAVHAPRFGKGLRMASGVSSRSRQAGETSDRRDQGRPERSRQGIGNFGVEDQR